MSAPGFPVPRESASRRDVAQLRTIVGRLSSSDGILLGAFTGLSYFVAYCHEWAYAQTFGYPPELIELRWTTVLGGAGTVVIVGAATVFFAFAADRLSIWAREKLASGTASAVDTAIAGIGSLVLPMIFGLNWRVSAILAGLTIVFWLVATAFGLRRYDPRIRAAFSIYDLRIAAAAAILSIAFVVIHTRFSLAQQKQFYLLATAQPEIVARIYGDHVIAIRMDAPNRVLLPVYRVVPLSEAGQLASVTLGRMTPICSGRPRPPLSPAQALIHNWLDDTPNEYSDVLERCRTARSKGI